MEARLVDLSARYEEAARSSGGTAELDTQLLDVNQKLAQRRGEQYQSKYTQAIAEANAKVQELGKQYHRENQILKAFVPGVSCPTCRRPVTEQGRRLLASLLRSCGIDLLGVPGFRTYYGDWTLAGPNGFLIPVRDKNGLIQDLKIRLDDTDDPGRKYRWLSSRDMTNGTRSYSWVHVTGDITSKRAYLTEGPLKGKEQL